MLIDVVKPIPVQMEGCGVHGDEERDVGVVLVGALDGVHGPVPIVLAFTPVGTLHPASD